MNDVYQGIDGSFNMSQAWQAGRCQEGILGFGRVEFPEVVHQLGDETTAVSFQLLLRFSPLIYSFWGGSFKWGPNQYANYP